ncbi:MAG TPA: alanine dehydrogenase [Peptococcaceae bacterium]|nr:alanine dehydrogenase [Peptococcaceae bacterium]
MIIGVTKEIKPQENRVGMTPAGIDALVKAGHTCYVEKSAGLGSFFTDEEYVKAGAKILDTAEEVYAVADMIIKVKEPLESEYALLRENQILFTYLHLAPNPALTEALLKAKVIGIAYETVQLPNHSLPLLSPMSEVAGRMAIQVGAHLLEKTNGGRGVLLGGVSGVEPAKVVVIGGGIVGINAVKVAVGLGAQVTVVDISSARLAYLDDIFKGRIITLMSNSYNIAKAVKSADLVIGAVLIPGARAPKLVTEEMVKTMKPGAVILDVAIDQGGSIATMDRITTLDDPYYVKHGVIHYAVANMPGAVPRTSTMALTNATLPYALKIASCGAEKAMQEDEALRKGLNVYKGKLTYKAVAEAQDLEYTPSEELF